MHGMEYVEQQQRVLRFMEPSGKTNDFGAVVYSEFVTDLSAHRPVESETLNVDRIGDDSHAILLMEHVFRGERRACEQVGGRFQHRRTSMDGEQFARNAQLLAELRIVRMENAHGHMMPRRRLHQAIMRHQRGVHMQTGDLIVLIEKIIQAAMSLRDRLPLGVQHRIDAGPHIGRLVGERHIRHRVGKQKVELHTIPVDIAVQIHDERLDPAQSVGHSELHNTDGLTHQLLPFNIFHIG